mmetsp:Transcript_12177/g.22436  ORF Transcript_12177/g.22436 Transcript_12177/m.22436 type:complete len:230 (-) Transcript_12177:153-842(-)
MNRSNAPRLSIFLELAAGGTMSTIQGSVAPLAVLPSEMFTPSRKRCRTSGLGSGVTCNRYSLSQPPGVVSFAARPESSVKRSSPVLAASSRPTGRRAGTNGAKRCLKGSGRAWGIPNRPLRLESFSRTVTTTSSGLFHKTTSGGDALRSGAITAPCPSNSTKSEPGATRCHGSEIILPFTRTSPCLTRCLATVRLTTPALLKYLSNLSLPATTTECLWPNCGKEKHAIA